MNNSFMSATESIQTLVKRDKELESIRSAIYEPRSSCHVVFIYGRGGMGKSRLGEEVISRGQKSAKTSSGNDAGWGSSHIQRAAFADLIDMTIFPLHAKTNFMRAVRNALVRPENATINFANYDIAFANYQRRRQSGGEYKATKESSEKAEAEFFRDYKINSDNQRMVITLDTVEKLFLIGFGMVTRKRPN